MSEDYGILKRHWPGKLDRIDRIENQIGTGMPDVNMCILGKEIWIELKKPTEPKRSTTKLFGSNHKLSIDQKNWILRQIQAGGSAFVLISTDKRWLLIPGRKADLVNDLTVNELIKISLWHELKPIRDKEKWANLRNVLVANKNE